MSCTFTCNACRKTAAAEYRFGRWQHPEGWWTRAATGDGENAGLTACSRACIDAIEHEFMDSSTKATRKPAAKRTKKTASKQTATKSTPKPAKRVASKKSTTTRKAA